MIEDFRVDLDEPEYSENGTGEGYSDEELEQLLEEHDAKPMIVKVLSSKNVQDLMALSDIPAVMIMPLTQIYTVIQEERNAMLMLMRRAERQAEDQGIDITESKYFQLARAESRNKSTLETWFYSYLTLARARDGRYLRLLSAALVDSAGTDEEGRELKAE